MLTIFFNSSIVAGREVCRPSVAQIRKLIRQKLFELAGDIRCCS